MERLFLKNCDTVLSTGVRRLAVLTGDGSIKKLGGTAPACCREIDLRGAQLFPGFIDIHCHGAVGVDVNSADADGLAEASQFLAAHGVTGWVPTLVPDSEDAYASAVSAIDQAERSNQGARVLGVHYEGIFANGHRCGALRTEYFREYPANTFQDLPIPERGARLMTLAPECGEGVRLVADLVGNGWTVSIGHTEASVDILEAAFDAGARHITHLFNAMTGLHHRDLGVAGWGLTREDVSFDIIADGHHVAREVLEMAIKVRDPESVLLISDSMALAGLGEGKFELWGKEVEVVDGTARMPTGTISGSVITMLDAVSLCLSLGFSPADVSRMSSLNPARLLGIESETGSIEIGKRADLVAVRDGRAVLTMVGGRVVREEL